LRRGNTGKHRGTLGLVMATTILGSALSSRVVSLLGGQLTGAATHGENPWYRRRFRPLIGSRVLAVLHSGAGNPPSPSSIRATPSRFI